ncbi:MAG TPA: hypothetical protein VD767_02475 [Thermomicrobiales bacterium]|nr:hypothetical protein [Thermomicrobiales bacterium]
MNPGNRLVPVVLSRRHLVAAPLALALARPNRAWAQVASPSASPEAVPWTDADLEAAGLTGPNSYLSPRYGYTVEWGDFWALDTTTGMPVRSDPNAGETGQDDLFLAPMDTAIDATIAFSGRSDDGVAIAGRLDQDPLPDTGGVRLLIRERMTQVTWVDLHFEAMTVTVARVLVNQVTALNGGANLFISFDSVVDAIEASFTAAQEILIHGEPLFDTVDWQDIADGLARWS